MFCWCPGVTNRLYASGITEVALGLVDPLLGFLNGGSTLRRFDNAPVKLERLVVDPTDGGVFVLLANSTTARSIGKLNTATGVVTYLGPLLLTRPLGTALVLDACPHPAPSHAQPEAVCARMHL